MVRRRGTDPTLRPSLTADPSTVRVTFEYLACAALWLLVGTAAGLIDALKLNSPDILAVPWLSFGRVRPIHTNTVFWGWSSMGLVGLALYVVARTSRTALAAALAELVSERAISADKALELAHLYLHDNAAKLYGGTK